MIQAKILTLILAGGTGGRMGVLTDMRAKPALPYAGVYRLIDFPLTNCMHSGLVDVWVIEQFQPHSINEHLSNGRPWDLDRTYGGLRLLQPHTGTHESGWHQGNADAIYRNKRSIHEYNPDILLVLSADHIYKLDYSNVIDEHLACDADLTMVITQVPREQASRFGVVQVNDQRRVTSFEYKPESPSSDLVTTEVFVYNAHKLLNTLDELVAQKAANDEEEQPSLEDFGHELLPKLVQDSRAYAYMLDGYWRDVGTIDSYWESHMDLLASEPLLDLDDSQWPILTRGIQRMPARVHASARIENSLISPGCEICGHVVHSVLAPGVVVEQGAVVRNAVVLQDTVVGAHATVEYTILDSNIHIDQEAKVGQHDREADAETEDGSRPSITLIGQGASIPAGVRVPAGSSIEPGVTAETFGEHSDSAESASTRSS